MNEVILRRKKETVKTEAEALEQILYTGKLKEDQVKPVHDEAFWSWEVIGALEVNPDIYSAPKKDITEKEAIEAAMDHLKTFEGNLRDESTEDEYIFTRVREHVQS